MKHYLTSQSVKFMIKLAVRMVNQVQDSALVLLQGIIQVMAKVFMDLVAKMERNLIQTNLINLEAVFLDSIQTDKEEWEDSKTFSVTYLGSNQTAPKQTVLRI